jgi:prolyl oligopeptidase
MFITRKKSLLPTLDSKPTQPLTTLLYGYGGFTVSQTPQFAPSNIVLMKNLNVMYVVASIRGGGEYGEQWHVDGSGKNKQKSYDDFIGAAQHLIQAGYTDANHLSIQGGSNGGTLVTAVAN